MNFRQVQRRIKRRRSSVPGVLLLHRSLQQQLRSRSPCVRAPFVWRRSAFSLGVMFMRARQALHVRSSTPHDVPLYCRVFAVLHICVVASDGSRKEEQCPLF